MSESRSVTGGIISIPVTSITCPALPSQSSFGSFAFASLTIYDPSGILVFLSNGITPTTFCLSFELKACLFNDLFPMKSFFLLIRLFLLIVNTSKRLFNVHTSFLLLFQTNGVCSLLLFTLQ